jgi:hypothetical protein
MVVIRHSGKPRKHKYNAKPCEVNGIKYRSQKEMKRHQDLLLMERAGEIADLKREVKFEIAPPLKLDEKITTKPIVYIADFTYLDKQGKLITEDTKGFRTPVYRLKKRLMKLFLNIDILET